MGLCDQFNRKFDPPGRWFVCEILMRGGEMFEHAENAVRAPSTANLPIFEREAIEEFAAEVGPAAAARALTTYLAETERRLAALRSLALDQRKAIHVEAHTLKGASGLFGLSRLSAAALRLERHSATMTAESYQSMRSDLEAVYARSRPVVVACLEELRGVTAATPKPKSDSRPDSKPDIVQADWMLKILALAHALCGKPVPRGPADAL